MTDTPAEQPRRGRGRPAIGKRETVRFYDEEDELIRARMDRDGCDRTEAVRRLVRLGGRCADRDATLRRPNS